MTKEKLAGPWQLVSFKATAGDKISYPVGEHPGGFIEITPHEVLGYEAGNVAASVRGDGTNPHTMEFGRKRTNGDGHGE